MPCDLAANCNQLYTLFRQLMAANHNMCYVFKHCPMDLNVTILTMSLSDALRILLISAPHGVLCLSSCSGLPVYVTTNALDVTLT